MSAATSIDTIATGTLKARLRPLMLATFVQRFTLWYPVEKLFEDEIGFSAASIGILAAAYGIVVPLFEIPSGILADRWSRRGVLTLGSVAAMACAAVGAASTNVATYVVAALLLGVFFAMESGTLDAIVYDTVVEETGVTACFERTIGRIRMVEGSALVASALVGGLLAAVTSPRMTYVATVPLAAVSIWLLRAFREPRLHQPNVSNPLREQISTTYRTLLGRRDLRAIIGLMVLTALLLQALLEFGPLWMVALAAPAMLYGTHWAGLTSALGLGGYLAGRLRFERPKTIGVIGSLMVASSVALTLDVGAPAVIAAQIVLALLLVATSIHLTHRLHDAIPSTVRAGVASGVGTLTWMGFLPFAIAFGYVSDRAGVHVAGWMMTGVAVATVTLLVKISVARRSETPVTMPAEPEPACA